MRNKPKTKNAKIAVKVCVIISLLFCLSLVGSGLCRDGFNVSAVLRAGKETEKILIINFSSPKDYYLYADKIKINVKQPVGALLVPDNIPEPVEKADPFSNKKLLVYTNTSFFEYKVKNLGNNEPLAIEVSYQGCSPNLCFMPESKQFQLSLVKAGRSPQDISDPLKPAVDGKQPNWKELAGSFKTTKRLVGYTSVDDFLNFIDLAKAGPEVGNSGLLERFSQKSVWLALLLILLGGLALNLTPCVLPMIPINLAIIGAGARAGSKFRGFALGLVYACGIALAYGIVGGVVVITGATFGTLNSTPWFNLGIALIFIFLGLAMFDLFTVDFSRFQPVGRLDKNKGFVTAFFMGSVSALLAGACVAPVVVATLVFSSQVYAKGNFAGLMLPFCLGVGMGIPWPFAGAGLSVLPGPGKWMLLVKKILAVIILLLGFYYSHLAYSTYQSASKPVQGFYGESSIKIKHKGWNDNLGLALRLAEKEQKPLLIDFWASWCKNCTVMNKTTLKNKLVREKLKPFIKLKFQAEQPNSKEIKEVLHYFGVMGLPTFLILEPVNSQG